MIYDICDSWVQSYFPSILATNYLCMALQAVTEMGTPFNNAWFPPQPIQHNHNKDWIWIFCPLQTVKTLRWTSIRHRSDTERCLIDVHLGGFANFPWSLWLYDLHVLLKTSTVMTSNAFFSIRTLLLQHCFRWEIKKPTTVQMLLEHTAVLWKWNSLLLCDYQPCVQSIVSDSFKEWMAWIADNKAWYITYGFIEISTTVSGDPY